LTRDIEPRQRRQSATPGRILTAYCFGALSGREQDAVEQHLMACDVCWAQFQRLDAAVTTLRFDASVRPSFAVRDVTSVLGLSGRLERSFGGHAPFAIGIAVLYGLEWTVGLWSELGYSYDRFGSLAWGLSLPALACVTATVLVAFWVDAKATRSGSVNGLWKSTAVLALGLGALVAALMMILPAERTILASFQTRTAASGYLKDAELIFAPLLVFFVPAFHTVLQLQSDLAAGRPQQVMRLFAPLPDRLVPRGMIYLSPRILGVFLGVYGLVKIVGTNYMLDALTPGTYAQLFTVAAYISTGIGFGIGIVSLAWYSSGLNDLKREAMAVIALERRTAKSIEH
jgi:Putative zinc-finger